MAASLTALPEELLAAIASYSSTSAVVSLALTSKQLNRIATPHLYHRIAFKEDEDQANYERLHSLVIQLIQHPEHAAYVEHLHIGRQWPPSPNSLIKRQTSFEDLHPILKEYLKTFTGVANRRLCWDTAEALIFILFHLTPNLRALNSSLPKASRKHWLRLIVRRTDYLLPNLRELAIVDDDGQHEHFEQSYLFEFRKLESVFVHNFKRLEWDLDSAINQLTHGNQEYMDHIASLVRSKPSFRDYDLDLSARHLEISDAYLDSFSFVDMMYAFPALRTFALDFRKDSVPEHPCFYSGVISVLSARAETLTALSIGGFHNDYHESAPQLDFSTLRNLKHLRISVSVFLGSTSNAQSLPDDRMRGRFPASLQKLVLVVYKREEHHILSALQHYIDVEPPIIPNLRELDICCHAPEAMYASLHPAAQRHHVHLRIFRKLNTRQEHLFIVPFVNTVEKTRQEISQVDIKIRPPVSTLQLEDLMPLEEYTPDAKVDVPVSEESSEHVV
ncbi:hypothetical protein P171DRAFT_432896 [Karstenula rhodostoma CBS 690.94]|uniref:F-box domain-containing protein n=1 Tax=Karstenula rhodostoma CBS 690.94 TaxID=1392251 RepID=A0A9P4U9R1_9PLEO|nr:hypothetical protein P171DRAFT_432896 [Karstenula rhodostoma CBS 690.94]